MNAAIIIIIILLGYFGNCIHIDYCSSYKISACIKYSYCKCDISGENQVSGCKLTCRKLNNSIDLFSNFEKNDPNTTHSKRLTFVDVEITFSYLSEINATYMKNFETVKKLNLSYNEMSTIAPDTFHNLIDLESLDLSHNYLSDLHNDLLRYLTKLENLSLATNQIQNITTSCLRDLKNLRSFNISRNNLTEIPEDLFSNTRELKVLSLAHNKLSTLPDEIFYNLTNLQILDLSNNQISRLQPPLFNDLSNLLNLSLSYNQIQVLEEETFAAINKTHIYIDLRGNPWICGAFHYWLYLWIIENLTIFESVMTIPCQSSEEPMNRTLLKDFEIVGMTRSINECETCKKCDCTLKHEWLIVIVNCTNRNLTSVPQKLPLRTRKVILDNNKIKSLFIEEESIHNWTSVSFIGLNNNLISSLQTLEELSLLKHLIVLNITGNKLQDIPLHHLDQLATISNELRLANNPWLCNCNTIRFQIWLVDHYRLIKDVENIRCATDDTYISNRVIYSMKKSELCPQPPKPLDYLDILNVTMGVLILLIISKVTYDYWHQKKTGKLPKFFGFNFP